MFKVHADLETSLRYVDYISGTYTLGFDNEIIVGIDVNDVTSHPRFNLTTIDDFEFELTYLIIDVDLTSGNESAENLTSLIGQLINKNDNLELYHQTANTSFGARQLTAEIKVSYVWQIPDCLAHLKACLQLRLYTSSNGLFTIA